MNDFLKNHRGLNKTSHKKEPSVILQKALFLRSKKNTYCFTILETAFKLAVSI